MLVAPIAFLLSLSALIFVPSAQAYDQPWNGNREDITGPDQNEEDEDCPAGKCTPEPDCNNTSSPVYTARGYLIVTETDIAFAGETRVGLKRTYNSYDHRAGLFGRGWVTAQESNIARTYRAVTEGSADGSPKTATDFESVPIFLTEHGRRYQLEETATGCAAPAVLFFSFEKQQDGSFKQVFEEDNDYSIFDVNGKMLSHYSDEDGTTIYYEYDDQNRLIKQFDSYGFELNFTYNEQGFVSEVKDQANRTWGYSYDNFGLLIQMLDPDGNTKDYAYQSIDHIGYKQHLLRYIDDNTDDPRLSVTWSEVTLYGKRAQRVASYTEEDGHRHTYTYSQSSVNGTPTVRVVKNTYQVNSTAVIETQTFEANKESYQILSQTNNTDSTQKTTVYDERGKPVRRSDKRGNITLYEYNTAGRLTAMTELAETSDAKLTAISYLNGTDRVAVKNEYGILETRNTYDNDLRLLTTTQIDLTNNQQRVWAYTYHSDTTDSQGNKVLGKMASMDGPQPGTQDTTRYTYNAQGLAATVAYPLNQSVSYRYNFAGQLTAYTDVNGVVTTINYDSRNRVSNFVREGRTIGYAYNGQDQLTQITDELGRTAAFVYSDTNELSRLTYFSGDYLTFSYHYQPATTEITRQYYEADGTLISTQINRLDPDTGLPQQGYLASTAAQVVGNTYNNLNELTQQTRYGQFGSATSATTHYVYDREGRLTQTQDALNGSTNFAYDAFDRLQQVNAANGAITHYNYSAWGDLLQQVSPDTGTTGYQLDAVGNITQHTNANNQQTRYGYDAQNRLVSIDYEGVALDSTLTYDQGAYGKGQLTTVNDGSGNSQYQYNDRALVTQMTNTVAGTQLLTAYNYSAAAELTGITYPSGAQVSLSYDMAGRLAATNVILSSGANVSMLSEITWHGSSLGSYQQGNGVTTDFIYDTAGRLIEKRFGGNTERLQNQLDNQGQITQQTWTRNGTQTADSFDYDVLGRLAKDGSATGNTDWLFDYDAVGNRLSQQASDNSSHILYSYRANSNRLTETNSVVITRDAAGNTLNDGRLQYQYDGMNRLSEVSDIQSGLQSNYTYNALGQRVRKQVNDQAAKDIRYVYGLTGELLGEYNPDGTRINEYVYHTENGTPELIAKIDAADNIVYIHGDHLGTPRLATSSSKTVVWRWQSDAFGVGLANEDPDNNGELVTINHRFPGQYYDQENGQHYNYFRDYDPTIGRYIQSDPIGLGGGINTYGYVGGNPLMYYDPLGLARTTVESWCLQNPRACRELEKHVYDRLKKKKKKKTSGKDGSKDCPSWAKEDGGPLQGETGKDYAKRLLDDKYGKENWGQGGGSEYSKIQKWADRAFE